jgi:hypothetical protein
MKTILLTAMFVLSLFLMCGGCASENHAPRGERWDRDRHSERSDRDRDRNSQSREQQHDERR